VNRLPIATGGPVVLFGTGFDEKTRVTLAKSLDALRSK
jgi:hypothetical protein